MAAAGAASASNPDVSSLEEETIRKLHACPTKAVVYVSGGASQGAGKILSVPGASNTVLEVVVPYARQSMIDLLGSEPEQYVSEKTAHDLARAAYLRAVQLSEPGQDVVGVAVTCALASEPPKRGSHRCFAAAYSSRDVHFYQLELSKGLRSRGAEDHVASLLMVQALTDASRVDCQLL
eukprot:gene11577-13678_t